MKRTSRRASPGRPEHGLYNEWSTIARVVLSRRDHQIQVGIAKRRKKKTEAPSTTPTPPAKAREVSR